MRPWVLASTSPYRRILLERLGEPFEVAAPTYEEGPRVGLDPAALALHHAEGKARSLASRYPQALLIGSDQVVELAGEALSKPGTLARARLQLAALAGREHTLWTAVAVHHPAMNRCVSELVETRVRVRALTEQDIERYLAREQPLDCTGCYRAEGFGITILEALRGDDPTAVIGLPLIALCRLLRALGEVV